MGFKPQCAVPPGHTGKYMMVALLSPSDTDEYYSWTYKFRCPWVQAIRDYKTFVFPLGERITHRRDRRMGRGLMEKQR